MLKNKLLKQVYIEIFVFLNLTTLTIQEQKKKK